MSKCVDLTGKKFGRLTVVKRLFPDTKWKAARWRCVCECGGTTETISRHLNSGMTKSCGCLQRDVAKEIVIERNTIHGYSGSKTYSSWIEIKKRCTNPNHFAFPRYGGAGISICKEWENDFPAFLKYMGERPKGMSIDRIDNNKGYEPGNVRWADAFTQANNKNNNKLLTMDSETKTLAQWCRLYKCKYPIMLRRINKLGWDIKKALFTPVKPC